jgi:hypothetical protein
MFHREEMSNKVFEALAAKGMDTSAYAERDRLESVIKSLKSAIYGHRDNGRWIMGKKEQVNNLFTDLGKIPFSDTDKKEQRDSIKASLTQAKSDLNQLYADLKAATETFNNLLGE